MATYNVIFAAHKTLTGTTADLVNLSINADYVEVLNRTGTAPLYFTIAGAGQTAVVSVSAANDTFIVLPGDWRTVRVLNRTGSVQVNVVGNANDYSVVGISEPG